MGSGKLPVYKRLQYICCFQTEMTHIHCRKGYLTNTLFILNQASGIQQAAIRVLMRLWSYLTSVNMLFPT